jgi:Tfp pilus assembly protein PilF
MAVFVASVARRSPAGLLLAPSIRRETIDLDTYELFQRGSELLAAGHAHQAEFAEALEIDPSNDYAHFGLGLCLARSGERTLAVGHLRLAVAMRPEVDTYRQALERVQRRRGREAPGPGGTEGRLEGRG